MFFRYRFLSLACFDTSKGSQLTYICTNCTTLKQATICLFVLFIFSSCNDDKKVIVSSAFADSLIRNYTEPAIVKQTNDELLFWKNRIDPKNPGISNESKYASALVRRFHLTGDIHDLVTSDSVLRKIDTTYAHKEAGPNMALCAHAMLQHRFKEADEYFTIAKMIGIKKYEMATIGFDVNFELGRYTLAEADIRPIAVPNDYGYCFRYAKLAHYKGELDTAIASMNRAVAAAGSDDFLKQAALSNVGDLYLHSGNTQKAYDNYVASIRLNAADLHSIMGIGWIALVHDKNDSLAEKIFQFVRSRTKSPDPLLKLIQTAEFKKDSLAETKYAKELEQQVTNPVYGNMYNKYMIDLYSSILHEPAKAEAIALKELTENRSTPQTQAWYSWALFCNGKKDEAYKVFQQHVSGKPLEGLELYWMGKLMQGLGKGYNAQQFFKAAYKNRYDLSPGKVRDLEEVME